MMNDTAMPEVRSCGLAELVESLDDACCGSADRFGRRVSCALARACREPSWLGAGQMQGSPDRYVRHLLHADPEGRYTLVALVWEPGQFSPVHAHWTWCGYGVVRGPLLETGYAYRRDAEVARPLHAAERPAGSSCFAGAGLDGIHRLGNAGSRTAVSLHVYGVRPAHIATGVNRVVSSVLH